MPFEIDFLPVGDGERSGDAIAVRYQYEGSFRVMIYDGGTKDSGNALVEHVKKYYRTDHVDDVVSSHPDVDHASGLSVVLEKLSVGTLWLHRPWSYSRVILGHFQDGRMSDGSLRRRLEEKLATAYELERIAGQRGITIQEPFQASRIGAFHILSPDKDWYLEQLVPDFEKSPRRQLGLRKIIEEAYEEQRRRGLGGPPQEPRFSAILKRTVTESWGTESLREDVKTSGENESSAVLYAYFKEDHQGVLLTGDSGVQALEKAVDYLEANGVSAPKFVKFIQVPHHGSRHNVSSTVLDRLLGPRLPFDMTTFSKHAYVSAGKDSTTHPRRMVVNAFMRRGARVVATQGQHKCYFVGFQKREGWLPVDSLEFSGQVEPWED